VAWLLSHVCGSLRRQRPLFAADVVQLRHEPVSVVRAPRNGRTTGVYHRYRDARLNRSRRTVRWAGRQDPAEVQFNERLMEPRGTMRVQNPSRGIGGCAMSIVPLDLQRRFERRWAARFQRPAKAAVKTEPRPKDSISNKISTGLRRAKEKLVGEPKRV
jgi:hypothetical protein